MLYSRVEWNEETVVHVIDPAPEDFRAYVAMRADGVVSVPGEEHPRELPWTR
ncbi:hypothetical protein ACIGD1_23410 [Streptomyces sp. NPDC085612]|uniref:hypothetical protein n=1 Tax=Streptomyces sp. NPDC085612 TaxID=3365732 RepID=UPI0037D14D0F